ncbi:hypothetical protein HYALB_00006030 [Hymenoscyphus albidus]|uniref:Uncharacterized protein n=1 Tax=Hymenoscyphus albidus TaxID=595503 RepID=A0A9N9Q7D1_9HELO|nr:hypothetical protein HYALB_00006030 [Hymenoscyphus albidus]
MGNPGWQRPMQVAANSAEAYQAQYFGQNQYPNQDISSGGPSNQAENNKPSNPVLDPWTQRDRTMSANTRDTYGVNIIWNELDQAVGRPTETINAYAATRSGKVTGNDKGPASLKQSLQASRRKKKGSAQQTSSSHPK